MDGIAMDGMTGVAPFVLLTVGAAVTNAVGSVARHRAIRLIRTVTPSEVRISWLFTAGIRGRMSTTWWDTRDLR